MVGFSWRGEDGVARRELELEPAMARADGASEREAGDGSGEVRVRPGERVRPRASPPLNMRPGEGSIRGSAALPVGRRARGARRLGSACGADMRAPLVSDSGIRKLQMCFLPL